MNWPSSTLVLSDSHADSLALEYPNIDAPSLRSTSPTQAPAAAVNAESHPAPRGAPIHPPAVAPVAAAAEFFN